MKSEKVEIKKKESIQAHHRPANLELVNNGSVDEIIQKKYKIINNY